eukprot:29192-Pelagococcus_subviridis.AAC.2
MFLLHRAPRANTIRRARCDRPRTSSHSFRIDHSAGAASPSPSSAAGGFSSSSIFVCAAASSVCVFSSSAASAFFSSMRASYSAGVGPPRFDFRKLSFSSLNARARGGAGAGGRRSAESRVNPFRAKKDDRHVSDEARDARDAGRDGRGRARWPSRACPAPRTGTREPS